MPQCRKYYLEYPLESLFRGVIKKLMLNFFEVQTFAYFLQNVLEWSISLDIEIAIENLCPGIIHINQPTCPNKLKEISLFLYFSCYGIKELLNNPRDLKMLKKEIERIIPNFQHLQTHWINSQPTVNFSISPRALNQNTKRLRRVDKILDYNTCVDKILQISPCYDLLAK